MMSPYGVRLAWVSMGTTRCFVMPYMQRLHDQSVLEELVIANVQCLLRVGHVHERLHDRPVIMNVPCTHVVIVDVPARIRKVLKEHISHVVGTAVVAALNIVDRSFCIFVQFVRVRTTD